MRAINLFSAVGVFDLGVNLAGFDIIAQVEFDDYWRLRALGNGGIWTIVYWIAKGIKQEITR